jgi:hypothetical protein
MRIRAARRNELIGISKGGKRWSISSVQNLMAQAVAQGLLVDRPLADSTVPRHRGRPSKLLWPAG